MRVITLTLALSLLAPTIYADGFKATCENIRLTNHCDGNSYCNLGASCKRRDGSWNEGAWINLYNYVGNNDGHLVFGDGAFSLTCFNIKVENAFLSGTCWNMAGGTGGNPLNLNACISNEDGNLIWSC